LFNGSVQFTQRVFLQSMIKRYIVTALILALLAPLNMGASAWMNPASAAAVASNKDMSQMHMNAHDHKAMLSSGQEQAKIGTHDHSLEECDLCMNCSNHCSSTAIVASFKDRFDLDREFATGITGDTSSRVDLLFRPPIPV